MFQCLHSSFSNYFQSYHLWISESLIHTFITIKSGVWKISTVMLEYLFIMVILIQDWPSSGFSQHSMLAYLYEYIIYTSTGYLNKTSTWILPTVMLAYWFISDSLVLGFNLELQPTCNVRSYAWVHDLCIYRLCYEVTEMNLSNNYVRIFVCISLISYFFVFLGFHQKLHLRWIWNSTGFIYL